LSGYLYIMVQSSVFRVVLCEYKTWYVQVGEESVKEYEMEKHI